jgi:RNA polymerase sigma-70 factor (ECF subfamily)
VIKRQHPETTVDHDAAKKSDRWTVLLIQARRGDRAAFDTLNEEAEKSIWRLAYRQVGDAALADDIMIETFAKAWHYLPTYNEHVSRARTWLYMIANGLVKDCLDKRGRLHKKETAGFDVAGDGDEEGLRLEPVDQAEPAPHEAADRGFRRELVERALAQLSDKDRTILLLYHVEQLSYEEIAAVLKCSVKAVGPRLTRARERFREVVDPHAQV